MNICNLFNKNRHSFYFIRLVFILFTFGTPIFLFAQIDHDHHAVSGLHSKQQSEFIENKGQWGDELDAYVGTYAGSIYFQANKLHFDLFNSQELSTLSEKSHSSEKNISNSEIQTLMLHKHYYQIELFGADPSANLNFINEKQGVCHFFLGDKNSWRSSVKRFEELKYSNIYPGIDVVYKLNNSELKYDFVVASHSDVSEIQLKYTFVDDLHVENGQLVIKTSVGEQHEYIPFAYQDINGKRNIIPCNYLLKNNIVSFSFPKGYDPNFPLVIDPQLIASTNSGSTEPIYGHTATYDELGNIFVGGHGVVPTGLPVTTGAYQITYGGGLWGDMTINKYNPDGTQLLFSTYLGGNGSDRPFSMVTDKIGNLYILGSSGSTNFPTTTGCIQSIYGGGNSDIVVSCFSTDGTSLIASTFIGGNQDEGFYYGEINLASNGDILIASTTTSTNFPITMNAFQTVSGGGALDGIVARLNSTMTFPIFITYLGGVLADNSSGIISAPDGTIYVTGSVGSDVFSFPGNPANAIFSNTIKDAYVIRLSPDGQTLINGTYAGSNEIGKSQGYFVQFDSDSNVEIVVVSANGIASTSGKYQGFGSETSIIKYSADLSTREWVSSIGKMTPTAFLVDQCDRIYLSGYKHNGYHEVTSDAICSIVKGFYLYSLNAEATNLIYGTYFGDTLSHVDGGTSRFDKNGVLYQAICTDGIFPSGPNGSFSANINNSYDMAVFKIDFEPNPLALSLLDSLLDQNILVCDQLPKTVNFEGLSANDIIHHWWFHDGSTSTIQDPVFNFTEFGDFSVDYLPEDNLGCYFFDTAHGTIHVVETMPLILDYSLIEGACNDTLFVELDFTGTADNVLWNMGNGQFFNHQDLINSFYVVPGLYSITLYAEDTVCVRDSTAFITLNHNGYQELNDFFMPNVFSGNDDGLNDTYQISSIGYSSTEVFNALEYYSIQIINRWGNSVFQSNPTDSQTWSFGEMVDGKQVDEGVYYYIVKYKTFCQEQEMRKNGFLHIVR